MRIRVFAAIVVVCGATRVTFAQTIPDAGSTSASSQLDLDRQKLALDERRFDLERRRFNMEMSRAPNKELWDVLVPLGVALVTGLITFFVTRWTERRKAMDELAAAYDQELRKERITSYKDLWAIFEPFALYSPEPVTYKDLPEIGVKMRSWYFHTGGLFMSVRTRHRYFALLWAVAQVWEHSPEKSSGMQINAVPLGPRDAEADEKKYEGFRTGDELPKLSSSAEAYRFIRALGSSLRTSMSDDVRTRFVSVLAATR